MTEICALCCAEIRSYEKCHTCPHFVDSMKFDAKRTAPVATKKEFSISLDPELEQSVDKALGIAEEGNLDRARALLLQLESEYPRNHMVSYGLGTVQGLKGNHEEAIRHLDEAINIYPYFVEAMFNRATAYRDMLDIPNAIRKYQEVLQFVDPTDFVAKNSREFIKSAADTIQKHHGTNLETFLNSNDEFEHACKAMDKGDWEAALLGFQNCAAQVPHNPPTHGNMGICLAALGRKAEALAALDEALEINPDYEPASANRILIQKMKEGMPADLSHFTSVNYAKEQLERRKS
jgi:tetratricopeptide (TPR) repeat protein